jgi:hypothetical protein
MVLSGSHGTRFALRVVKQPHSPDRYDDWVTIAIQVQSSYGAWSARDTCLLAAELDHLITWLEQAAQGKEVPATLRFLEPELAFRLSTAEAKQKMLRVCLRHRLRPAWAPPDTGDDLWIEFPVTDLDLARAAHSLRQQTGATY